MMRMRFGPWHPIEHALEHAPQQAAGVWQVRSEGLRQYPLGRSAMVAYGCSGRDESLAAALTATSDSTTWTRLTEAGGCWIRFGLTEDPERALLKLHEMFSRRFGAPPACNT